MNNPDLEAGKKPKGDPPTPPGLLSGTGPHGESYLDMMREMDSWLDEESIKKLKQASTTVEREKINETCDVLLMQNLNWSFVSSHYLTLDISPPLLREHLLYAQYVSLEESNGSRPLSGDVNSIISNLLVPKGRGRVYHDWWHICGAWEQYAVMQFVPVKNAASNFYENAMPVRGNRTLITFYPGWSPHAKDSSPTMLRTNRGQITTLGRPTLRVFINAAHLPHLSLTTRCISTFRDWWTEVHASFLWFLTCASVAAGVGIPRRVLTHPWKWILLGQHRAKPAEPLLSTPIGTSQLGFNTFLESWLSEARNMNLLHAVGRVYAAREDTLETDREVALQACCVVMNIQIWSMALEILQEESRYLRRVAVREPNFDAFIRLNTARDMVGRMQEQIVQDLACVEGNQDAVEWAIAHMKWDGDDGREQMTMTGAEGESVGDVRILEESAERMRDGDEMRLGMMRFSDQLYDLEAQLEKTFQLLISAITVLDSAEAKKQGKRTTLLTIVAAFYLPLTLAVGTFGMNVKGMEGVEWWWAVVVSAVLGVPSMVVIGVAVLR